ncbi:MAG: hypothetical protein WA747_13285, partial [Steroidobacteraceae bacterium]
VGALDCGAAVSEQGDKRRQVPQLAGKLLRPIEAEELPRPSALNVYGADPSLKLSALSVGEDSRRYRKPARLKCGSDVLHAF